LGVQESEYKETIAKLMFDKSYSFEKALKGFSNTSFIIYRVLANCLYYSQETANSNNVEYQKILLLYWQLFFNQFFCNIKTIGSNTTSIKFYGHFFLDLTTRKEIYGEISNQLTSLFEYYKMKENKTETEFTFMKIYYAMDLWIKSSEQSIFGLIKNIDSLEDYFEPSKLVIMVNQDLIRDFDVIWTGLLEIKVDTDLIKKLYPFLNQIANENIMTKSKYGINMLKMQTVEKINIKGMPPLTNNGLLTLNLINPNDINISSISKHAKIYEESYLKQTKIDQEYISFLQKQYENKEVVKRLELSCIRGPFCKRPCVINVNTTIKYENPEIIYKIKENRIISDSLYSNNYCNYELCVDLLKIELSIDNLIKKKISDL
jgi:hypothetical protein